MRKPEEERICHDPLAQHFLTPFYLTLRKYPLVGKVFRRYAEWRRPGLLGGILARTRYIDECLKAALDDGIKQLVVLGAGNDSRGYQLSVAGSQVKVFEVDHPATQAVKIAKLWHLFGALPSQVIFVAVDFGRDDLLSRLLAAGYDRSVRTLFIWEGVIYYLSSAAVDETLSFVAHNSGPGSSLVFDYFPLPVVDGTSQLREARNLRRQVARLGEPFLFGLGEEQIGPFLQERGLRLLDSSGPAACKKAWFHGANASIAVSEMFRFVHATHGGKKGGSDA